MNDETNQTESVSIADTQSDTEKTEESQADVPETKEIQTDASVTEEPQTDSDNETVNANESATAEKKIKINKNKLIKGGGVALGFLAVRFEIVFIVIALVIPSVKYSSAVKMLDNGNYGSAYKILSTLDDFKDSEDLCKNAAYLYGKELMDDGNYAEAEPLFAEADDYKDSKELENKCNVEITYAAAVEEYNNKDYVSASRDFEAVKDSKTDAAGYISEINLVLGKESIEKKDYDTAIKYLADAGDSDEIVSALKEARYLKGKECLSSGDYENAYKQFALIPGYKDIDSIVTDVKYQYAVSAFNKKDYTSCVDLFKELGDYKDSKTKRTEAVYGLLQSSDAASLSDAAVETLVGELKSAGYDVLAKKDVTDIQNASTDTNHNCLFIAGTSVAATCTAGGYTNYKCSCGATAKGNAVKAKGHNYVGGTCQTKSKCSVCGKEGNYGDHSYKWVAESKGFCAQICTVCGEEGSFAGHDLVLIGTSDYYGYVKRTYKCSRCGFKGSTIDNDPEMMVEY